MKKKALIIALSVLVVIIVTVVTLCFTLFTVQNIKVSFRTSTTAEYNEEEIIASSGLKQGKNIFFLKKKDKIENIEKAFPYLEVINIESKFPSSIVIYLRERQSFYSVQSGDEYLILDSSLKILEKTKAYDPSSRTSPILLPFEQTGEAGEKLDLKLLPEVYDALLLNGRTRADGLSLIKSLEYFESENAIYHNRELGLKLTLHSGREVFIHNAEFGLAYKLAKCFAVESNLHELSPTLSDEIISGSQIHINNYLGADYTVRDSYFYLMYNGEKVEIESENVTL